MSTAARNYVKVADFVHFTQIGILDPHSQCYAAGWIEPEPPAFAERDFVLMVIRDRALSLIADQECAVCQFDERADAMEPRDDSRKFDIRFPSEIKIVISVS